MPYPPERRRVVEHLEKQEQLVAVYHRVSERVKGEGKKPAVAVGGLQVLVDLKT